MFKGKVEKRRKENGGQAKRRVGKVCKDRVKKTENLRGNMEERAEKKIQRLYIVIEIENGGWKIGDGEERKGSVGELGKENEGE